MNREIWKPVLGYEEIYEVSNQGRVCRTKRGNSTYPGREVKAVPVRGYMRLNLFKSGKCIQCSVHRIVYEAFNGAIPSGMQINHLDGNPRNNNLENLEMCTPLENVRHSIEVLGRQGGCKKHSVATRTEN